MAERNFAQEKDDIQYLADQRSADPAVALTNRIFGKTASGARRTGFIADTNQKRADRVVASGRTRLSVYSVARRYLASKKAAPVAV